MKEMANDPDPAREEPRTGVPIVSRVFEKDAINRDVDNMADRVQRYFDPSSGRRPSTQ